MNNLYKIKKIVLILLILTVIVAVILNIWFKREESKIIPNENLITEPEGQETFNLCYYRSNKTDRGFYDVAWLKTSISGDKITGEFQNLPSETDSKIGSFDGIVGPVDQQNMSRRANVWWNSFAEGMRTKEELVFLFGDGSATVGFGEMINRGDGVYVYKNKDNLTYIEQMEQIDCENLDEKLFVEKYTRENIATIATDKPVLGGIWYVVSVIINPSSNTGEVTYEDGHIQSKASFIYNYTKIPQNIEVTKFELIKT